MTRRKRCRSFSSLILTFLALMFVFVPVSVSFAVQAKVLHGFSTTPYGMQPESALVSDAQGNLYGYTLYGGASGVVFQLVPNADGTWTENILHNFAGYPGKGGVDGDGPDATLSIDAAGNVYGTTYGGGLYGKGIVFKLTHEGKIWRENILHSFTGFPFDPANPQGVILDKAGNLYGSTPDGGSAPCFDYYQNEIGCGTIYKLTPQPDGAWGKKILYTFTGVGTDVSPRGPLTLDDEGNLFGVTTDGDEGLGEIFELLAPTASGETWTKIVLQNFPIDDGAYPSGSLVFDKAGNIYGTLSGDFDCVTGALSCGAIFTGIRPTKGGNGWQFSLVHTFQGSDGAEPTGALAIDRAGNLYGTTIIGGPSGGCLNSRYKLVGCGTIYQLSDKTGDWVLTMLYQFKAGQDGGLPYGGVTRDSAGNLFATASAAGLGICPGPHPEIPGCGTVVKLARVGQEAWGESTIYSFPYLNDGLNSHAGLVEDSEGNLYGTTTTGGAHNHGTVFKVSRQPNGASQTSIVYSFGNQGPLDGATPVAGLIFDSAGNLYGTTQGGGIHTPACGGYAGCGTVFKLSPSGDGRWVQTILYRFTGNAAGDGSLPSAALAFDDAGNLYGTTMSGGVFNPTWDGLGTVFRLSPASNGTWTESVLHSFGGTGDGCDPVGSLVFDKQGNLYGTAPCSTVSEDGMVFELSAPATGNGPWSETIVYGFTGSYYGDGSNPLGALVFDDDGRLYGTTSSGGVQNQGAVFRLTRSGNTWTETTLHSFDPASGDGAAPYSDLIFDSVGNLYGTTREGGALGVNCLYTCGTVFKLTKTFNGWQESMLHSFKGGLDGNEPLSPLIIDSGGNLYGTTSAGGRGNSGTVFEILP
jgi:uncharacterized repeat protein (TIGR03803 family)